MCLIVFLCVYSVVLVEIAIKEAAVFCYKMFIFIPITRMKVFGFSERAVFL